MANIDLFILAGAIAIKGDDAAARTITIGQQVTFSDIIVIDTATCGLTAAGALTLAGLATFNGGATSIPGGSNNEAWGDGALAALTSAGQCTAVGKDTLIAVIGGSNNVGFGFNAGSGVVAGTSNMAIGPNTLTRADTTECVAVGTDALRELNATAKGVGIGFRAGKGDNTSGSDATGFVAIGNTVGQVCTTADNWTAVGDGALVKLTTGDNNTVVGQGAGGEITTETGNVLFGRIAGDLLTGSNCTLIGDAVGSTLTSTSDELRIHNDNLTAILSGDMSTNQLSVNNHTRSEKVNITVGSTDALECLSLDQLDDSEGFINFKGTSAASAVNPISSLTTPGVPAGFVRGEVNSVDQWIQVFDDPSTPEITLAAAVTTFAINGSYMEITGDGGANTIATITAGVKGMLLTLKFVDALVTITDTAASTVDTMNLSAAFTSTADDTMQLIHDGNKWFEVSRSVN